ncbi:hypothetical protein HXA31_05225 [Salipaludibacillus agaradhaerens]|uniref:Uncharacterized protein n=1 Tax=Salipaludibacillus agaradhaerens TaxID=76935 RepID=A0A9Q4B298_SALAG|nr:hypothetical protein [Salipaludibacillus agaradhaerens]MCR6096685.1 hypothetical protein [Salipaludibacillus agaradhaerens]MCR6113756.1 hypothetical protein [Salipaludibacillus agaradhaerens]
MLTDFQSPYLTQNYWSEWLLVSFLLLTGVIYWTMSKRLGFQVIYLTLLSLSFGFIITMYFPYLYTEDELLPLTHPHIQAAVTLFTFFIPLVKRRIEIGLCLAPPVLISVCYLFLQNTPVFSIVGGIMIGGFISYMYYRSLDWMGAMPEPYLFSFAIILPLFIAALIFSVSSFLILPGILLGLGTGATIEQFKVRVLIRKANMTAKLLSLLLGSTGLIIGYLLFTFSGFDSAFSYALVGIVTGLWISLLVPGLMRVTKLYDNQGKHREII